MKPIMIIKESSQLIQKIFGRYHYHVEKYSVTWGQMGGDIYANQI